MSNTPLDDEGRKEVRVQRNAAAAAFSAMWAAIFHAVRHAFALLGQILAILIEALASGFKTFANLAGVIISAYLHRWVRRIGQVPGQAELPDGSSLPDGATSRPSGARLAPPLPEARRQADNARKKAERLLLDITAEILVYADHAADLADDAAKRAQEPDASPTLPRQGGVGILSFEASGLTYLGETRDGQAQGYGILRAGLVEVYRGHLAGNRCHGFGIDTGGQVACYRGQFRDGVRHGKGQLEKRTWRYTGLFEYGQATGYGVLETDDMRLPWEKYAGQFLDEMPHGYGVRYFRDGQRHYGEFKFGEPQGYGVREFNGLIRDAGRWDGSTCDSLIQKARDRLQGTG